MIRDSGSKAVTESLEQGRERLIVTGGQTKGQRDWDRLRIEKGEFSRTAGHLQI
jgi:hypothetical protein